MSIQIFDVLSGKELRLLPGYHSRVHSLAFSPDGTMLASGGEDDSIHVWNITTGECTRNLVGHTGGVFAVVFSPDGKMMASGSEDESIRLWDPSTGKELSKIDGHKAGVTSLAFSPDSQLLASGSQDNTVRVAKTDGTRVHEFKEHTSIVEAVAFSPDGQTLASASWDKSICLWRIANGQQIRKLTGHSGGVKTVVFSPSANILASAGGDRIIRLWDLGSGRTLRQLTGHRGLIFSLAFAPGGQTLASSSDDRTIRLWDVASGRQTRELPATHGLVSAVAFSPDGKYLASVNRGGSTVMLKRPSLSREPMPASTSTPLPINLEKLWFDLALVDVKQAQQMTETMVANPTLTVRFLQARLKPATPLDPARFYMLLGNLGAESAAVAEQAKQDFIRLGPLAEPGLRRSMADMPDCELRQRIEQILARLQEAPRSPQVLRELRAVGVLGKINTAEAKMVLQNVSRGVPEAWLTKEASLTLQRLESGAAAPS